MKYLLITTTENRNTGDELIRIGVQNLIKEIDPAPEFILLDKEKQEHWENKVEFDKAILCGMPLFWNNEVSTSQDAGWWGALMEGWVSERKKDFLMLGVGNVIGRSIWDERQYQGAIRQALQRAYAVTTRNFCADYNMLIPGICPSVFALTEIGEPKYKLCNFMPDGAHDKHFNPLEAETWQGKQKQLSDYCRNNDFHFIVHSSSKCGQIENPKSLGWTEDRILQFDTAEEYLEIYKHAKCYFGNRIHAAMLTASAGKPALAIGYDSRLMMLNWIGYVQLPSTVTVEDIKSLLRFGNDQQKIKDIREIIKQEKNRTIELLKLFIEA